MQKVWKVKEYSEEYIEYISKKYGISNILAKMLDFRGIDEQSIELYLNGSLKDLKDPFIIKDMDKFTKRVKQAIDNHEKICIYGDYDVDGITSIVVMYQFLTGLGAEVIYYLPDRLIEGYGINNNAIDEIAKQDVKLMITVDCGITAINEVEHAKSLGIDVLITDHHECAEKLPEAYAIVNTKQKDDNFKFKMHAGVGIAFKCITALSKVYGLDKESYLKYLDIVAIGTISDIVSLQDENRIISKYGLVEMKKTKNIGLKALLNLINFKAMDSFMVSFGLAPRINACGRMGNASVAVKLLLEKDEAKAKELALLLDGMNVKRQQIEKEIFDDSIKIIEEEKLYNKNSLVLYGESWHNGVIGIVASRLVNIYYKPVILLTKENGMIRGSGRCPMGFSLYDALSECSESLIQFGGHELAAGLTIEEGKIKEFSDRFEEVALKYSDILSEQVLDIDLELELKDLNVQILKDINTLKPCGQCNPAPLFLYRNLKVQAIRTIKDDKHLKFVLKDSNKLIDAVAFSQGNRRDEIKIGDKIDVVCSVDINTYNTPKTIELIIQDFKKSV